MTKADSSREELLAEIANLRYQLEEAEETLCAIGNGEVDILEKSLVATDLMQQKRNEEIMASEMLARSLIEQAAEAILVCDERGMIIRASELAHQLCAENPLLKPFDEQFPLLIKETKCLFSISTSLNGGCYKNIEVEFNRNDAESYLLLNATPLKGDRNHIIGCVVTLTDITGRRQAEEVLKTLNKELGNRVMKRTAELADTIEYLQFEIAERANAEEKLLRLNRLHAVLSETNQAILRTKDRNTLFNDFCRIAVEDGNFKLAWVGLLDKESGELKRVAAKGATAYLDDIRITINEEPEGLGPVGRSVRDGTDHIVNDFQGSPITRPWHERGRIHGVHAAASIALRQEGQVIGALALYADKKDFFDEQQTKLLRQMGADVSFALDNIVRETRRRETEQALREETAERLRTVEALREKEQMLLQQSRQAAMGEMIGNIAHQWRQPLNTLGLTIQGLLLYYDLEEFNREFLEKGVSSSMELIQHMSRTIDDFRNYFRPDKEKNEFKAAEAVKSTLTLIEDSFKNKFIGIEIIAKNDPVIYGYRNEFAQGLLNILNNARDALKERKVDDPRVKITICSEGEKAVVTVADNAGGIAEDIMDKIFDPYFTTKGPQGGTGVGLFMSKTIIEKNMGGRLTARNLTDGAEFRIEV
jgi:signal transduction histidine kinase/PAS domain-containing protein